MSFSSFGLDAELLGGLRQDLEPAPIEAAGIPAALGGSDLAIVAPAGEERLHTWALPLLQRARRGERAAVLVGDADAARRLAAALQPLAAAAGVPVAAICGDEDAAPEGGVPVVSDYGWDLAGAEPIGLEVMAVDAPESLDPERRARLAQAAPRLAGTAQLLVAGADTAAVRAIFAAAGRTPVAIGEHREPAEHGDREEPRRPRRPRREKAAAAAPPGPGEGEAFALPPGAPGAEAAATPEGEPSTAGAPPAAAAAAALPAGSVFLLEDDLKHALLYELLNREVPGRAVVFCRTRYRADRVADFLNRNGIPTDRVHGNRSPGQRNDILARFREGRLRVVVATDGVLRGGELPDAAWRLSFDVPEGVEAYRQRVVGAESPGLMFAAPEESSQLAGVERAIGAFPRRDLPELDEDIAAEPIFSAPGERPAQPPPRPVEERQPQYAQGGGQGQNQGGGKRKRRGRGGKSGGGAPQQSHHIEPGNRMPPQQGGGRGGRSGKEEYSRWDFEQPVLPDNSPYSLPPKRPGDRSRPSHVPAAFRFGKDD